jgi:hypothetical protein
LPTAAAGKGPRHGAFHVTLPCSGQAYPKPNQRACESQVSHQEPILLLASGVRLASSICKFKGLVERQTTFCVMIRRFIAVAGSFPFKGNLAVNLGGFELPIEIRFALIELGDHAMPPTLVAERHRGGIGPGKPRLAAYSVTALPRWPPSRQRILDTFLDRLDVLVADPLNHFSQDLL